MYPIYSPVGEFSSRRANNARPTVKSVKPKIWITLYFTPATHGNSGGGYAEERNGHYVDADLCRGSKFNGLKIDGQEENGPVDNDVEEESVYANYYRGAVAK